MKKYIHFVSEILELFVALLVLVGILISIAGLITHTDNFMELFVNTDHFREYLEQIFSLVIGIEFLQMLCKPNSDNVLETLIFLVARHMIVGETNSFQDFVSVISIALLCVLRRYMHNTREAREKKEEEMGEKDVSVSKKGIIGKLLEEIQDRM